MATLPEDGDTLLAVPPGTTSDPLELVHMIEEGLPLAALDNLAKAIAPDDSHFKFRIVPKATLERKRKQRRRLTSAEGDRVARLWKVFSFASSIYKDEAKVLEFLTRPHVMLEGKTPRDVALSTGPGADFVINLLGRAAYGGGV